MIHMIEFRAMGCAVNVQLEADVDSRILLTHLPARLKRIENRLTRFSATSELMRFNARAGEKQQVSKLLFKNIAVAKQAARITDGLFNPLVLPALVANGYNRSFETIEEAQISKACSVVDWREIQIKHETRTVQIPKGSAIDLGGVAKGWTAMHIAESLSKYGACIVNIGGDIVACDAPDGYSGWLIEIEDPFTGEAFASIELKNSCIATSGVDYRRWKSADGQTYHHIVNPHTGLPATTDVRAVSVIHNHAPTAEAYTKAVLLKGAENGLVWLNQQWNAGGIVFQHNGRTLGTSTFTTRINQRNHIS